MILKGFYFLKFFICCSLSFVTIDFVEFLSFVVPRLLSIVLPCQLKLNEPVIVYVEHSEDRPSGSLSFIFKWLLCSTSIHLHSFYVLQTFASFLLSLLLLLLPLEKNIFPYMHIKTTDRNMILKYQYVCGLQISVLKKKYMCNLQDKTKKPVGHVYEKQRQIFYTFIKVHYISFSFAMWC